MPEKKKTKTAPATEKPKKKGKWGGRREGAGRKPAMTLEEKINLGLAKTRDYKLAGYANATAYKRNKRLGTTSTSAEDQYKIPRCDVNRAMPRCGKCALCSDGGPEYWQSEDECIAHLFGDDLPKGKRVLA